MKKLSLIALGGGDRTSCYLKYLDIYPEQFKLVGIAEPIKEKRDFLKEKYNVPENMCVDSYEKLLNMSILKACKILESKKRNIYCFANKNML